MGLKRSAILSLLFSFCFYKAEAQLIVDTNTYTPDELVKNVLLGNSIIVSNIKYTGAAHAIGYFNGTKSNIGIANGVLMTTGSVEVAAGAYNPLNRGVDNRLPGDSALTAICGDSTFDACILEFDFVPFADTVSFDFAFGSQEYPAFTCCKVNDVFAFFISGPGIVGQQNIALVPSTAIPISINTINGNCAAESHCGGACCNSNSKYYVDNDSGTTVGYGGFTTVIKALSQVQCGQTYHIRIAIADANDPFYDSGVFLAGGTFRGGTNPLNISTVPVDSICPNDKVSISFPINDASDVYTWQFDGGVVQSGSLGGPYVVSWPTSGPKQVKMLVTGACTYNNDSVIVNINPCDVVVPNVFTPGSGDANDVFFIANLDKYPNTNLKIFDRWGDVVYHSTDYHNDWTGSNATDGTYYYLLTLANREVKKGFVTILRK